MKLRVSIPTYVYIVNEDDQGESYLLFPLPGQTITNPVPAGMTNRIPGTSGTRSSIGRCRVPEGASIS